MGVDHAARLVWGVDAEAARDADGRSILARFLTEEWGPVEDADAARAEPLVARQLLVERFDADASPGGLRAFLAGSGYVDDDPDATRVIVGVLVLEVAERHTEPVTEPVDLAAVDAARDAARQGLRALGVAREPELLLVGEEA